MIELLNFRLCLHEKFREAQEENVVCEKCCENFFVAIVFYVVFAKVKSVEAIFFWSQDNFPPPLIKSSGKL